LPNATRGCLNQDSILPGIVRDLQLLRHFPRGMTCFPSKWPQRSGTLMLNLQRMGLGMLKAAHGPARVDRMRMICVGDYRNADRMARGASRRCA